MLAIRLKRVGFKKHPLYRVVVSDSRKRPTGEAIDEIGTYNPNPELSDVKLKLDRVDYWLKHGAKPSNTVKKLIEIARAKKQQ
ncbi:MAG: 30S ribosomal protein S16 [Acidobacteria bacterium]|nr:30S ribosomal protein S16 [Acidobacteriota bacterium]